MDPDELRMSWLNLAAAVVARLPPKPWPVRAIRVMMVGERPLWGPQPQVLRVGDPMAAVDAATQSWQHWPEYERFCSAFVRRTDLHLPVPLHSGNVVRDMYTVATVFDQPLKSLCCDVITDDADMARADQLFDTFELCLSNGTRRIRMWYPIYFCTSDSVALPFSLGPGIDFRRLDATMAARIAPTARTDNPDYSPNAHVYLTVERRVPFRDPWQPDAESVVNRATAAIRLIVDGSARAQEFFVETEMGGCEPFASRGASVGIPLGNEVLLGDHSPSHSHLESEYLPAIHSTFRKIAELERWAPIAMRRFHPIALRTSNQDRLLDAVVALENLLLHGEQGSNSFKLALRGAWLLGKDLAGRREVYGQLKVAYDARSELVHGAGKRRRQRDWDEVVETAIQHLREVILLAGDIGNHDRWCSGLESIVFGSDA